LGEDLMLLSQHLTTSRAGRLIGWSQFKMATLLALAILVLSAGHANALTLLFDQSAYSGELWLQVQDPMFGTANDFKATYDNGNQSIDFTVGSDQVLMSAPVKLSDIGTGGLNITFSESAVLFIYYDDPTGNSRTAAPAHMVSTQRFMPFEVTMMSNDGDQGNLTAINYFTAPLSIRSYENNPLTNPGEPVLQSTGFGSHTAAQIGAQLATASNNNPDAVINEANGHIVRYLGPSNFTSDIPWPSFIPYAQSINAANQDTTIERTNGFNFAAPDNTPVYQFGADMTATAAADGSLTITGSITVSVNDTIKPGNPALPTGDAWTGATFSFSASNPDDFNVAIYGQAQNAAVNFTGAAWSDFQTFTQGTLRDPSMPHNPNPHDPDYNPSLYDLGAYDTTLAMFVGEVTTGLLGGFFNSDYEVGGVPIKNMPSKDWWSLDPLVAYSEIQDDDHYNLYASVIYDLSGNTVYGVPFSDRFGTGPLVQTYKFDGTDVNYWVIGIGAPIPEPGTVLLLGLGSLMMLGRRRRMVH
jgi:hypothetical protein